MNPEICTLQYLLDEFVICRTVQHKMRSPLVPCVWQVKADMSNSQQHILRSIAKHMDKTTRYNTEKPGQERPQMEGKMESIRSRHEVSDAAVNKRKEKTTPFGVNLMRSQLLF